MNFNTASKAISLALTHGNMPILLVGKPAIGKTSLVKKICKDLNYEVMIKLPILDDCTDYKGLPVSGTIIDNETNKQELTADFIPYGDLRRLLNADKPLVCFLDEIGQAPASIQAALMGLILERKVNGIPISNHVRFIAATNNKKDNAGVSGILTPLLSRFACIIPLECDAKSWCKWAISENFDPIIVSFISQYPDKLCNFNANKEITNFAAPRTYEFLNNWLKLGVDDIEIIEGCIGSAMGIEFKAYWKTFKTLGNLPNEIVNDGNIARIPDRPDELFLICTAISYRCNDNTVTQIFNYLERLPAEFGAFLVKLIITKNKTMECTNEFIAWVSDPKNKNLIQ